MKFFCIDYGRRRIGTAVSDPSGMLARSKKMIDRELTADYFFEILSLLDEEKPDELVIGLPLDIDDNETEMSREVREFTKKLTGLSSQKYPVNFQDESYSSVKSQSILIQTKKKKKRSQKTCIDNVAACVILQEFLDAKQQYGRLT